MQIKPCKSTLVCENSTAEYILQSVDSSSPTTKAINKCLLINRKKNKGIHLTKSWV